MMFTEGDTVAIIELNKIKKGIIKNVFLELSDPVAIVDFDGDIRKVFIDDIAKVQEDNNQEDNTLIEKSEITITPDEFMKKRVEVVKELNDDFENKSSLFGLEMILLLGELHKKLFIEAEND